MRTPCEDLHTDCCEGILSSMLDALQQGRTAGTVHVLLFRKFIMLLAFVQVQQAKYAKRR